jgi:hypothetical protein
VTQALVQAAQDTGQQVVVVGRGWPQLDCAGVTHLDQDADTLTTAFESLRPALVVSLSQGHDPATLPLLAVVARGWPLAVYGQPEEVSAALDGLLVVSDQFHILSDPVALRDHLQFLQGESAAQTARRQATQTHIRERHTLAVRLREVIQWLESRA